MDISLVIKHRLAELGLEQRELASAAQVTESYISQLLTRKKAPPAPNRTDIYEKIERFLKLPEGELARLAEADRQDEAKRRLSEPPVPLFKELRDLVLRKCKLDKRKQIREIFAKQPFGELERLVTQRLLDVCKNVAKEKLESENWVQSLAELSNRSYEEMRVAILEFLDMDVFDVSIENYISLLGPLIETWDIDLATFGVEVVLDRNIASGNPRRFEFVEKGAEPAYQPEPGLAEFLEDVSLSGDATQEEIEFLKKLRFKARRPNALYYYRELQNLRDPLHFRRP